MAAGNEQDIKFSDKKIEAADENMKTVDCLRGRLLAERQASKASKEESELIGKKLIELENKLREENKLRKKAEKKLQFFMKKLQCLKIDNVLETSNSLQSFTLSYKSSHSSCSSTSSAQIHNPESKTPNPDDHDCTDTSISNSNSNSTSICELDPNPNANTKGFSSDSNNSSSSCEEEDSKIVGNSFSPSLKNSSSNKSDNEEEDSFIIDNSLALVPVNLPPPTTAGGPEIVDKNVGEALNALRLARERIQFCIERRHMIRIGPSSSKLSTLS